MLLQRVPAIGRPCPAFGDSPGCTASWKNWQPDTSAGKGRVRPLDTTALVYEGFLRLAQFRRHDREGIRRRTFDFRT